ncbi:MAG: Tol-Pal system protein TolB [Caulobacteraceae bacterium]|nr:Tol-Pal system protein TolB [Caulobacter sp.]
MSVRTVAPLAAAACALAWTAAAQAPPPAAAAPPAAASTPTAAAGGGDIEINQGQQQALPIALPPLAGADARTSELGAQIMQVVAADLERSGFFRALPASSFPANNGGAGEVAVSPDFGAWRPTGAQDLVGGRVTVDADGKLKAAFRLWDLGSGRQLDAREFTSTPDNYRRVAHKIADVVYHALTGEAGYFDTRIAFVAESGAGHQVKRLAIMDQDGANPQFLTSGAQQVLSPRFSQHGQELAYMSLTADSARVYLYDLETGRREVAGDFSGMVFAPRFSPDGNQVVFSVQKNGNSDIYKLDLRSRQSTRLTTDPSIDTSPSYSPDGSKIVFNSDRGGSPQLYVMNADGSDQHRISFGKGRYTSPVWSPKGDLIAFVRQNGGDFHIGVMTPSGDGEKTLTTSSLDESPSWAPNGRVIIFTRGVDHPRLWLTEVSGRVTKPAPYSAGATDPAWSPLLK